MIIDIYAHHISRRVGEILLKTKFYGEGKEFAFPPQNADVEVRLKLMDKHGVDVQALSQTTPILLGFGTAEANELCRLSNDDNYALCKAHPKRFVNIAIINLLDMKGALKELDRNINELDCRGVTISTNQNGKGLDSPEYYPFWEKIARHDLPVLMHPTHWESYPLVDMEKGWRMMHIFGWPFDTTQAVWRLIFGGVLDRYPTLKIVTHHLGAMLPYFSRRIENNVNRFLKDKIKRPLSEYWKAIYGDTALDGSVASYPCGYAFFGPDRMLYGTDYPFGPEAGEDYIRENLNGLKAMNIPEAHKKKIFGESAKKLLKIK